MVLCLFLQFSTGGLLLKMFSAALFTEKKLEINSVCPRGEFSMLCSINAYDEKKNVASKVLTNCTHPKIQQFHPTEIWVSFHQVGEEDN